MNRISAGVAVLVSVSGLCWAQTSVLPPEAPPPTPPPKTWADDVKFKGDLRYRVEQINDDSKKDKSGDTITRDRDRIRARLGAEAKVNDATKAGIEFSTGGSDPISGNQSLGGGFDKEEMRLNLGYIEYNFTGSEPNRLKATGGKMKNPFITQPDDLVWDSDLTPEGMAAKGEYNMGIAKFLGNAGYFWIQERSDKSDTKLYAGQGAVKLEFTPEVNLMLGASYYAYDNIQGFDVIDWENKNNSYGNSTINGTVSGSTTNKAWKTEFTPVVYFAQFEVWVLGRPLDVYAQELTNIDADQYDQGHMYGVSYGKLNLPKTWELGYSYAELEKDATLGMFTDSDRWGGGTDGKGHKVSGKYQLMKNLQAGVSYFFADERKISDSAKSTDYDRLQIDLVASF
ncbi:MAG: putative porin [Lentisphaerae bacterium]|nr:putative porin [Lentisphaerota bacterium]